jgi:hypothetical protein
VNEKIAHWARWMILVEFALGLEQLLLLVAELTGWTVLAVVLEHQKRDFKSKVTVRSSQLLENLLAFGWGVSKENRNPDFHRLDRTLR